MRSSFALLALSASLTVAHRDVWQASLPRCWQNCFSKTEDSRCTSSRCVCDTAEDSTTYLAGVVECAKSSKSQCTADIWGTKLVLAPLELICLGLGDPLPEDNIAAAYAAALATEPAQSTRRPAAGISSKRPEIKTKSSNDQGLTATLASTVTQTTTDSSGNTLVVIIPIMVGPSGVFTGDMSTSTITATSSNAPSSALASPSPSEVASPPTPTQQAPSSTSAAGGQRTNSPASGNGSPFENMQAGASRWAVSGPMLGLGAVALLFMRM